MPSDSVLSPLDDVGDAPALTSFDITALQDVEDPWHRSRLAEESAKQLRALVAFVLQVRQEAVRELVDKHGVHQTRVAHHLGVSRARVGQIIKPSKVVAA